MRIAVNTRLLVKDKLEGIGWFTYENLKRITRENRDVEFYFLFDRKHDPSFIFSDNITPIELFPQARHPFLYYLWFEYSVPAALKKINPDVFLSPDGYLSLKTKTPSITIFHDLNFEHYPEDLPYWERKYYRRFFPRYAHKARRIATVSEYSKADIGNKYNISPDKIDVVYNGGNESFAPLKQGEIQAVRNKLTKGNPYFVFIGALHPRKNLVNLFKAFDRFCMQNNAGVKLVVVGEKKWWTASIRQAYESMQHKEEVIFTGRLSASQLHEALASALALAYVSYFEGFGIPIVEAYRCKVPVITSKVTSMPEVAGDGALLVDPFEVEDISNALQRMYAEENTRNELIAKGWKIKDRFTWDKSAERLWNTIMKVINKEKNNL